MPLALVASSQIPDEAEVVAFGVFADLSAAAPDHRIDAERCRQLGFSGKRGESLVLADGGERPELLIGLGEQAGLDLEALRRVGAIAARAAASFTHVALELSGLGVAGIETEAVAAGLGEGALLSSYGFTRFKSTSTPQSLQIMTLVDPQLEALQRATVRATVIKDAVFLARDLVNTPAGELTPTRFAEIAGEWARSESLTIEVLDEVGIVAEGLGGLAGVAAGSDEPPRMVQIHYRPPANGAGPTVALVGKGITFDSGGLSLKSAEGMMTMKADMGGAAAVLATLVACARLAVPVAVSGYMPITENMPGGRAIKPGDVLKIRNGKTIEVLNTDAEGRLVLADALSLAAEGHPDAIIDLATLTGACVAALGRQIAGLMGNDDRLIDQLRGAGRRSGEPLWPLPLPAGYRSQIDSELADMKNIGAPGQAGALTAALLLEEFVADLPWAHLDIAGPVRSEEDSGYLRKGATGFGVRTLIELLEHYAPLEGAAEQVALGISVLR